MPFGCRESTGNIWCDLKKERHLKQPLDNGTTCSPICAQVATVGQLASCQEEQLGPNRSMGHEQEVGTAFDYTVGQSGLADQQHLQPS